MMILIYILLATLCYSEARHNRIVGGSPVYTNDDTFKFITSFQNNKKQHWCAGSFIHPRWILTAAHCVKPIPPKRIVVNTYNPFKGDSTVLVTMKDYIHPMYTTVHAGNDIALIHLKDHSHKITRVVLNNCYKEEPFEKDGQNLIVAGWGLVKEVVNHTFPPQQKDLLQVEVPIVNQTTCQVKYNLNLKANQICAGDWDHGGVDSCQGDSGGPLVYKKGNLTTLVGIVSYGKGCARPNFPGVYTRVSSFIDWIQSTMGNDKIQVRSATCRPTPNPTIKPTKKKWGI